MTLTEIDATLAAMCEAAIANYWSRIHYGPRKQFLYFRPAKPGEVIGEIQITPKCPGPEWSIADGQEFNGFMTRTRILSNVSSAIRRLPILGAE